MFMVKKFKAKMDSYDEVHDVKNVHDIVTPPESLDNLEKGTSSRANVIKFTEEDEEEKRDKLAKVTTMEVIKNFTIKRV